MGSKSFPKGDLGCVSVVASVYFCATGGLPILLGHSGVPLFLGETYSREAHGTHYSTHCCGRSQGLLPLLSVWGPLSLSYHLCSLVISLGVSLGGMTQTHIAEGSMLLVTLLLPSRVCSTCPWRVTRRQEHTNRAQRGSPGIHMYSSLSPVWSSISSA